jgi:hypothetical protein
MPDDIPIGHAIDPPGASVAIGDHILLTYRELAGRLGISEDGARHRAKRRKWERIEPNHPSGPVRLRVPAQDLTRDRAAGGSPAGQILRDPRSIHDRAAVLEARLEAVIGERDRLHALLRQLHDAVARERELSATREAAMRADLQRVRAEAARRLADLTAEAAAREADLRAELERTRTEGTARVQDARADADRERQERIAAEERHRQDLAVQEQRHTAALAEQEERHRTDRARLWVEAARLLAEEQQPMTPKPSRPEPKPASRGWLSKLTGR